MSATNPPTIAIPEKITVVVESLVDVPLTVGSFFVKWRLVSSGRVLVKGKTTNSNVHGYKIVWNEQFSFTFVDFHSCQLDFHVYEVLNGSSKRLGITNIGIEAITTESIAKSLLLEHSKTNAALQIKVRFGEVTEEDSNSETGKPAAVAKEFIAKDYLDIVTCSSDSYNEDVKLVEKVFIDDN